MRWRRVIVWAVAAIAVGVVGWMVLREREPSYKGKTLSEWLEQRQSELSHTEVADPVITSADGPLLMIGTNGLPILMRWLRYEDPNWMGVLYGLTARLPQTASQEAFRLLHRVTDRAQLAEMTICALGPGATNAIPELCAIMNDPKAAEASVRAISVLADLGSAALPQLLAALADPNHSNRAQIIHAMSEFETNAMPAIPVLVECLGEGDWGIVEAATGVLGYLKLDRDRVVPALARGLTNVDYRIQLASAEALGNFGDAAQLAVPRLMEALGDPDQWVRAGAEDALEKIAPEELRRDKATMSHPPPAIFHSID